MKIATAARSAPTGANGSTSHVAPVTTKATGTATATATGTATASAQAAGAAM